ncbi:hypothetical protein [Pseudomonas pergaminensis]
MSELAGKLEAARSSYDNAKAARIATLSVADSIKCAQLQDELKALHAQLKTQRADRVAQLDEAIAIASSLGIFKSTTPSSLGDSGGRSGQPVTRTEVNNHQIPLYFMGVDALMAERALLQKRNSDDFTEARIAQIALELQLLQANREVEMLKQRQNEGLFLSGVEALRAEQARLRNLNVDMSGLKLVTIDKEAIEPLSPAKPKEILVILFGIVLGLVLGIITALVCAAVQRRRDHGQNLPVPENPLGSSKK